MCSALVAALNKKFPKDVVYLYEIPKFFPIFSPDFFGLDSYLELGQYWWDIDNVEPRIKAFDKLIKYYEDISN